MIDLYILDQDLNAIGIIDDYKSLIWTPRYYEPGDFEIYARATEGTLALLQLDRYVMRPDSEMIGIIETVRIESNPDSGDYIIATGRDLGSILDRRIVWSLTNIEDTVENGVRRLLTENFISPTLSSRKVENFVLGDAQGFTETLSAQYGGDSILEVVVNLCKKNGYGFRVILNDEKKFEFQLYQGSDRSYNQTSNPFIVFSPEFENIVSSNYNHDKSTLKNACNVWGEGEEFSLKTLGVGSASGLDRREMFVEAMDITSELDDGSTLSTTEYNNLLIERGKESLAENPATISFEGEVESVRQFVFGRDYFLGDIVTVKNSYGVTEHPRVIEVIQSHDENGLLTIPAFSFMEVYE